MEGEEVKLGEVKRVEVVQEVKEVEEVGAAAGAAQACRLAISFISRSCSPCRSILRLFSFSLMNIDSCMPTSGEPSRSRKRVLNMAAQPRGRPSRKSDDV